MVIGKRIAPPKSNINIPNPDLNTTNSIKRVGDLLKFSKMTVTNPKTQLFHLQNNMEEEDYYMQDDATEINVKRGDLRVYFIIERKKS